MSCYRQKNIRAARGFLLQTDIGSRQKHQRSAEGTVPTVQEHVKSQKSFEKKYK